MANGMYDAGREGFLKATVDFDTNNIKASLLDASDYTRNLATQDFYDDVSAAEVDASGNLASKTTAAGVADAADVTLTAVTGDAADEVVVWADSGTPSTSALIANWDTGTGLPVTPNGGDITIAWNASGMFKL